MMKVRRERIMQDIIVFGHGRYYKSKMEELKKAHHIIAFLDNIVKPGTVLTDEDGMPVYNPEDLKKLPAVPIMMMSARSFEMWMQLKGLGVEEERMLFGTALCPYYDEIERMFARSGIEAVSTSSGFVLRDRTGVLYQIDSEEGYQRAIRELQELRDPTIGLIADMPLDPVSRRCGHERGTPIDRYYIEKFLDLNKKYIKDRVMEVADDRYTLRYHENIKEALMMHVEGWGKNVEKIDLENGDGVSGHVGSIDCFICTQTIQMIYDMRAAVKNIFRMLKPGGTALITIAGIAGISLYDYHNWGEYWRATPKALRSLMEEAFEKDKIEISCYGNVKTTIAFLYGLCTEDLKDGDLAYDDGQFPMLIGCVARR